MRSFKWLLWAGVMAYVSAVAASPSISTSGWACTGNCGTSGANGVVPLSPFAGSTAYGWVSSAGGVTGLSLPGIGGTGSATNGSRIRSGVFTAAAGDDRRFPDLALGFYDVIVAFDCGPGRECPESRNTYSGWNSRRKFLNKCSPMYSIKPGYVVRSLKNQVW